MLFFTRWKAAAILMTALVVCLLMAGLLSGLSLLGLYSVSPRIP